MNMNLESMFEICSKGMNDPDGGSKQRTENRTLVRKLAKMVREKFPA